MGKGLRTFSIDVDVIEEAQRLYPRQLSYLVEQFLCNLAGMEKIVNKKKAQEAQVEEIKIQVDETKKHKAKCKTLDELNERAVNDWDGLCEEDQNQWTQNQKVFLSANIKRW